VVVFVTHSDDDIPKINCEKSTIFDPHLETPKDTATKSGETHVWDTHSSTIL